MYGDQPARVPVQVGRAPSPGGPGRRRRNSAFGIQRPNFGPVGPEISARGSAFWPKVKLVNRRALVHLEKEEFQVNLMLKLARQIALNTQMYSNLCRNVNEIDLRNLDD